MPSTLDDAILAIDEALESGEEPRDAVGALVASAYAQHTRFRTHARLAELFDRHAEVDATRVHARLAIACADGTVDAEDATLLARAIALAELYELGADDLRAIIGAAAPLARSFPDALLDAVVDART